MMEANAPSAGSQQSPITAGDAGILACVFFREQPLREASHLPIDEGETFHAGKPTISRSSATTARLLHASGQTESIWR